MTKLEQAARQALEALENYGIDGTKSVGGIKCTEAITALRKALEHIAASGKPIAGQTNTQFMEGYRIGLAEMREKCAKVAERFEPDEKCSYVEYASAAIRAINFEGDTGFRPVSEMIAEHKQDPKKAAAIEKAKMRKAEQEPVAVISESAIGLVKLHSNGVSLPFDTPLYAAPVRTKDLTDAEVEAIMVEQGDLRTTAFARAIIAADREKNNANNNT